jgi:hypothetical protein
MRNLQGSHKLQSHHTPERNKPSVPEKDEAADVAGRIEKQKYFVNFIYKDLVIVQFIVNWTDA